MAATPENKILVIGELNVDLIASGVKMQPRFGHEILAEDFSITLGSASAIFACGAARLGCRVTFISLVGEDDFGLFCVDALRHRGIETDRIVVSSQSKTGVTVVMSGATDRAMVTYLGAISELRIEDVPPDAFDGHQHLHLTSYYLQTALQPDFPRLMRLAKEKGLTVSFDPNSDPDNGGIDKVAETIRQADILFLNEGEALQLTRKSDIRSACIELGGYCPLVVAKLGAQGSIAYHNGEFIEAGGFQIDAVDTTGAGDSFAAGFVHAFLEDKVDIYGCLTVANACGALSTRRSGGTDAQPDLRELGDFLSRSAILNA